MCKKYIFLNVTEPCVLGRNHFGNATDELIFKPQWHFLPRPICISQIEAWAYYLQLSNMTVLRATKLCFFLCLVCESEQAGCYYLARLPLSLSQSSLPFLGEKISGISGFKARMTEFPFFRPLTELEAECRARFLILCQSVMRTCIGSLSFPWKLLRFR